MKARDDRFWTVILDITSFSHCYIQVFSYPLDTTSEYIHEGLGKGQVCSALASWLPTWKLSLSHVVPSPGLNTKVLAQLKTSLEIIVLNTSVDRAWQLVTVDYRLPLDAGLVRTLGFSCHSLDVQKTQSFYSTPTYEIPIYCWGGKEEHVYHLAQLLWEQVKKTLISNRI